jgi:hypothetical protein
VTEHVPGAHCPPEMRRLSKVGHRIEEAIITGFVF